MKGARVGFIAFLLFAGLVRLAPQPILKLSTAEQEQFLANASIGNRKLASKGITGSERATLSDGKLTHDAHIQYVDISKTQFQTDRGTELNFRDSYKFNLAAYKLARLLDLNMVPVCVFRKVAGKSAAVDWWVDNVIADEESHKKKGLSPPDIQRFNDQMYCVRVFDNLIYNVDRNLGNVLIDKDWNLWMIDHSRSFRLMRNLKNPKDLVKIDRTMLANLRKLDEPTLSENLRPYLTKEEVKAILPRRDLIVKFFGNEIAQKGENAVLCDLNRHY